MEDYPRTVADLERRFATEEACRSYLADLRWPTGFRCPRCGGAEAWSMGSGLLRCRSCQYKLSLTAGTVFEGTRKPLVMWFRAIWWVVGQKNGASAKGIQRMLELGSYQTAWAWLHKMRRAMVRPGRDQLGGLVEMDETYVGGEKPGKRGRGALGKVVVAVAVEDKGDDGIGRIRLAVVPDASQKSLAAFSTQTVEPGATIRTDDWSGYGTLPDLGYPHTVVPSHELKIAHRTIALLKSWLAGTHQGAVSHQHLGYYLQATNAQFYGSSAAHRGLLFFRLLQNAMMLEPTTYRQMVKGVRGPKPANHKG